MVGIISTTNHIVPIHYIQKMLQYWEECSVGQRDFYTNIIKEEKIDKKMK